MKSWERIKWARVRLEMTQIEVAREVGVALPTYILWERGGTKMPHKDHRSKLEEVLRISLEEDQNADCKRGL